MNIIQFPVRKPKVQEFKFRVQADVMEDGYVWYRVEDLKTGTFGEWIKIEDEENDHD